MMEPNIGDEMMVTRLLVTDLAIDDTGITDRQKGHLHLNSVAKLEFCHHRRFDPKILPSPYKYDSLVW